MGNKYCFTHLIVFLKLSKKLLNLIDKKFSGFLVNSYSGLKVILKTV